MKKKSRYFTGFLVLFTAMCILFFVNLIFGSVKFSLSEIISVLFGNSDDVSVHNIIFRIRLPRITAALILGGALSVSGFLLQTFFANPIAGPFTLGISSGAKLSAAIVMIFFLSRGIVLDSVSLVIAAFVGSMLSMGFILLISVRVKKMSVLIISGVMIGYICSAVTDIIVTFAEDSNIVNLHNWSMGTFSGTDWNDIKVIAVISSVSLVCAFLLSKPMGAYQMGEGYAVNMGVNIKIFRAELILLSSLLSACVTAFAGPVSFVGIAVPHLVKSIFGTAKPIIIIPASFMGGAVFCLLCDLIARTLFSPVELSISSVTAVFGVPVVMWIMLKKQRRKV
ncbi:MAG: iron ABC transporter permease [Ruminococcus sp.]|nr:iron ABC transporter permease [Ruminococcus sp.]MDE7137887.1 iron ABC transporter permease [Ruminococcus sp.]